LFIKGNSEGSQQNHSLFAHKVWPDYHNEKRAPKEERLTNPSLKATASIQEDGFILQQTEYGDAYNTKKYLQENELVNKNNKTDRSNGYQKLSDEEIAYQNIALKSRQELLAFNDYKLGLTPNVNDLERASQILNKIDAENERLKEYPRLVGPIPPYPYEEIYCTKNINEMGDGFSKRYYERVYDSPFINRDDHQRYLPYESDLKAMHEYENSLKENNNVSIGKQGKQN
jgi:hypothetical protein